MPLLQDARQWSQLIKIAIALGVIAAAGAVWLVNVLRQRRASGTFGGTLARALEAWENGDRATAAREFTAAIAIEPANPQGYLERGRYREMTGDVRGSLDDYSEAMRLKPDDPAILRSRGVAWQRLGNMERAIADYTASLQLASDVETLNCRGVCYLNRQRVEDAARDFSAAIEQKPGEHVAWFNRSRALLGMRKRSEALADLDRAIELAPDQPDYYHHRAELRYEMGDLAGTLSDADAALQRRPKDGYTLNRRAIVRYTMRQYDKAIADYTQAIACVADDSAIHANRGYSRRDSGDPQGALVDFAESLRLEPDNIHALRGRTGAWRDLGEFDKAMADITVVMKHDPAAGLEDRGYLAISRGDYDAGFADLREAQAMSPGDPMRANGIAWRRATLPDPQARRPLESVQYAMIACEMTGFRSPEFLDTLAAAQADAGRFEKAVEIQTKVIEMIAARPNHPVPLKEYEARLELYRSGQPYREPFPRPRAG